MERPPRSRPDEGEWEVHKDTIRDLYLVQELPLAQLISEMSKQGLNATKAQMEYRLKQWNFRRNLTTEVWRHIDRRITKRKLEGKESDVLVSGVRLKRSKVEKETSRNRKVSILPMQALSPKLPAGLSVVVRSPGPVRVQSPWPPSMPWIQFSSRPETLVPLLQLFKRKGVGAMAMFEHQRDKHLRMLMPSYRDSGQGLSRCAAVISAHIPETYEDESLVRAGTLLSGSKEAAFEELFKGLLFQFSNKKCEVQSSLWDFFKAIVAKIGVAELPLVDISKAEDPTVLSFMEKIFALATEELCDVHADTRDHQTEIPLRLVRWLAQCGYNLKRPCPIENYGPSATALQWAVTKRAPGLVRLLLEKGARVDAVTDNSPVPPLEIAIIEASFLNGRPEVSMSDDIIHQLLAASFRADLGGTGRVLHLAIEHGRMDVLRAARTQGVGLEFRLHDPSGRTSGITALTSAAEFEKKSGQSTTAPELFKYILENTSPSYRESAGPLIDVALLAASKGNDVLLEHVCNAGFDFRSANSLGITPLHCAVARGQFDTCGWLLSHGAGSLDHTALYISAITGDDDIFRRLIKNGYDVDAPTQESSLDLVKRVFEFVRYYDQKVDRIPRPFCGRTSLQIILCVAVEEGDSYFAWDGSYRRCVLEALRAGAKCPPGMLDYCIRTKRHDLTLAAIQGGADVNETTDGGETYLQRALREGMPDIALALQNAGARFVGGEYALAVGAGDFPLATTLLARGANMFARCPSGASLLEEATRGEVAPCLEILDYYEDDYYDSASLCGSVEQAIRTRKGYFDPYDTRLLVKLLDRRPHGKDADLFEGTAVAMAMKWFSGGIFEMLLAKIVPPPQLCYVDNLTGDASGRVWRHPRRTTVSTLGPLLSRAYTSVLGTTSNINFGRLESMLAAGYIIDEYCLFLAIGRMDRSTVEAFLERLSHRQMSHSWSAALFFLASRKGDPQIVRLLVKHGYDVNGRWTGNHPHPTDALQTATLLENLELVSLLLDEGADTNGQSSLRGYTALQYAARCGHLAIAKTLLEHDVPARANAHRSPGGGTTALEGAAELGRLDMIALLLSYGAETTGTGHRQFLRAIKLAERNGHHAVGYILRNHRPWTEEDQHRLDEDKSLLDNGVSDDECSNPECGQPHSYTGSSLPERSLFDYVLGL